MNEISRLKLIYDVDSWVTREEDPNDKWSRESTDASVTVQGLELATTSNYADVTVPFHVEPGDVLYALIGIYTTGDSFGSDGGRVELVDVFTDQHAANAALKILSGPPSTDRESPYVYKRQNRAAISYHPPWMGYFETLDDLSVYELLVE